MMNDERGKKLANFPPFIVHHSYFIVSAV